MKADHKKIARWLENADQGSLRLPNFQREEVWDHTLASGFIKAVLKKRPLGFFLVLEVDPAEPQFETKPIADTVNNGERCQELLLDGQQRLTALWRAFEGAFKNREFYVSFDEDGAGNFCFDDVESPTTKQARAWSASPRATFQGKYIPLTILDPRKGGQRRADAWKKEASSDPDELRLLSKFIDELREIMLETLVPFLPLGQKTKADEAIDIFVAVNRSSMRLSHFDIAVAMFEAELQEPLRNKIKETKRGIPEASKLTGGDPHDLDSLAEVGDVLLKAACVIQDIKPTNSYKGLDFRALDDTWDRLQAGLEWTTQNLLGQTEHIWWARHLPSGVPLRVIPALHKHIPTRGDNRANAISLIRSYLWRAFVTDWYSKQANERLFADYRCLQAALEDGSYRIPPQKRKNTVFDVQLPSVSDLLQVGWPKQQGALKRAILAVSSARGARDLETDTKLTASNVRDREYHHIFPVKQMTHKVPRDAYHVALNCMLLEPDTNASWRAKLPGDYIDQRYKKARQRATVDARFESHLVPVNELHAAKESSNIAQTYSTFLKARAKLVHAAISSLCNTGEL